MNGSKQWITNAGWADLFILFAKVDGTDFSAFLLERNSPGLTVGDHEKLLGLQGSSVCALQLDNVPIPVETCSGRSARVTRWRVHPQPGPHEDVRELRRHIEEDSRDHDALRRRAEAVRPSDRRVRSDPAQAGRHGGADVRAESVAYRTAGLVYAAAEAGGSDSLDRKLQTLAEFSIECAMAKVIGSETYNGVADDALQVYGGNGYSEEYPAARWYRDSRITRIYEGTSEICRLSIAKTILKRASRDQLPLREAVAAIPAQTAPRSGTDLPALRAHVAGLKQVFLIVLGEIWNTVDPDQLLAPDNQQLLGSLADIAMETYRAESTVLRVSKLAAGRADEDLAPEAALATLVCFSAADRVRQESTEILAALVDPGRLAGALHQVGCRLPVPAGLIAARSLVARTLSARHGALSPSMPS